jgi:anti-anti-sigma factor
VSPLSVTLHRRDPAAAVVALLGEHDAYTAARLENELAVLVDDGLHVVVDLSGATFVDSHTLSVLLAARHDAEAAHVGFVLVLSDGEYTQVHRILEMTGLDSTFAVGPTVERALADARAGRAAGDRLHVS